MRRPRRAGLSGNAAAASHVHRVVQRVVVRYGRGPAWGPGPLEEQPGWDDHYAFVAELGRAGTALIGGPLADGSGALLLLEGVDVDEATDLVDADPFVAGEVFVLDEVQAWDVAFDATRLAR